MPGTPEVIALSKDAWREARSSDFDDLEEIAMFTTVDFVDWRRECSLHNMLSKCNLLINVRFTELSLFRVSRLARRCKRVTHGEGQ